MITGDEGRIERVLAGMTQAEVGAQVGVDASAISRWERMDWAPPALAAWVLMRRGMKLAALEVGELVTLEGVLGDSLTALAAVEGYDLHGLAVDLLAWGFALTPGQAGEMVEAWRADPEIWAQIEGAAALGGSYGVRCVVGALVWR